jgi:hypothetical protein
MTDKMKIKVIKRVDAEKAETAVKAVKVSKKAPAREMVSTVTNWVNDFQNRKREETKVAIERFFSSHPRPSES